jgi:hypothetical protein
MLKIVVASSKVKMAEAEVNLVKQVGQVVLVIAVMKIVRLACTTVVHLVLVLINQDLGKSSVKRGQVKVLIVQVRAKIEGLVVNQGLNLVKNSQKAS